MIVEEVEQREESATDRPRLKCCSADWGIVDLRGRRRRRLVQIGTDRLGLITALDLSKAGDLAEALCRDWGFRIVHQKRRRHLLLETEIPSHQRIPIPDHDPIRLRTLNSILRLVVRHGNKYSANWSRSGGFGGGGWNRYGYGSVTGPYGNTYSRKLLPARVTMAGGSVLGSPAPFLLVKLPSG